MRISDWSSDVCSSDLVWRPAIGREDAFEGSPRASVRRIADIRRTTPLRQITSGRKRHQRARGDAHVAIFGAGVAAVHHQADIADSGFPPVADEQAKVRVQRIRGLVIDAAPGGGEREAVEIERRSEEHTSELQSLMRNSYAVFCLTKKTNTIA